MEFYRVNKWRIQIKFGIWTSKVCYWAQRRKPVCIKTLLVKTKLFQRFRCYQSALLVQKSAFFFLKSKILFEAKNSKRSHYSRRIRNIALINLWLQQHLNSKQTVYKHISSNREFAIRNRRQSKEISNSFINAFRWIRRCSW